MAHTTESTYINTREVRMGLKYGRNDPCPCGRLKKYKNCCGAIGIDYSTMTKEQHVRHLTLRGKNLLFLDNLYNILDLHKNRTKLKTWDDLIVEVKKALTPNAVSSIYQCIPLIWPDRDDYIRCTELEKENSPGLFIGSYVFDSTLSLVNKYGLYENKIIMIDPIIDHRTMADKYNPVAHPEMHLLETLNTVLIWMEFEPWINSGDVVFTRNPAEFDYKLMAEARNTTKERYDLVPELRDAKDDVLIPSEIKDRFKQQMMLLTPDATTLKYLRDKGIDEGAAIAYISRLRLSSPYYMDGVGEGQLLRFNSGANYELGKYLCNIINGHILTDLRVRWIEMEHDRRSLGIANNDWEMFSKHFQQVPLQYLDGLKTIDVLKLRSDGHLNQMRDFLKKLWLRSSPDSATDQSVIESLKLELDDEVRQAATEWKNIDGNLSKWFVPNVPSIGMQLLAGTPWWITGVTAAFTGTVAVAESITKHKNFQKSNPAGFFLEKR
jgi:hypothetical protein